MTEKIDLTEEIKKLISDQSKISTDIIDYAVKEGIITVLMKPLLNKQMTDIRIPELGVSATISEIYDAEHDATLASVTNIEFDNKDYKFDVSTELDLIKIYSAAKNMDTDPEEALRSITDRVIIANWYNKEHIEYWLGEEISDEEYRELIRRWNRYGNFDDINMIVSEFVINEHNKMREEKHELD